MKLNISKTFRLVKIKLKVVNKCSIKVELVNKNLIAIMDSSEAFLAKSNLREEVLNFVYRGLSRTLHSHKTA